MTATPCTVKPGGKVKQLSMDDEAAFGKCVDFISFGQAAAMGITVKTVVHWSELEPGDEKCPQFLAKRDQRIRLRLEDIRRDHMDAGKSLSFHPDNTDGYRFTKGAQPHHPPPDAHWVHMYRSWKGAATHDEATSVSLQDSNAVKCGWEKHPNNKAHMASCYVLREGENTDQAGVVTYSPPGREEGDTPAQERST
eukprot:gene4075-10250_t